MNEPCTFEVRRNDAGWEILLNGEDITCRTKDVTVEPQPRGRSLVTLTVLADRVEMDYTFPE